ncbi:MAG: ribonuclease H-like domain-containing protein [Minisyncoccota bacterium]
MATLVFDIETIGEDFDTLDPTTKDSLTHWMRRESGSAEEYDAAIADFKTRLGFSPLTGAIAAIGVLDYDRGKTVVYFQAPGEKFTDREEDDCIFKQMTEEEMLIHFWEGVKHYQEFVSFNGRAFDVPFLMVRSAAHRIRPTKNLLTNRYLSSQRSGARHIDLLDQLSFYGAVRRKGNLHLWCRAMGIESPKADGITGDDVGRLFAEKKFLDIARYNSGDLRATAKLYEYWRDYVNV